MQLVASRLSLLVLGVLLQGYFLKCHFIKDLDILVIKRLVRLNFLAGQAKDITARAMFLRFCICFLLVAVIIPNLCQALEVSDGGIRLCGRDFIRTVVMSCGGSRWKRYSPEPGQGRPNPYRKYRSVTLKGMQYRSPSVYFATLRQKHRG